MAIKSQLSSYLEKATVDMTSNSYGALGRMRISANIAFA